MDWPLLYGGSSALAAVLNDSSKESSQLADEETGAQGRKWHAQHRWVFCPRMGLRSQPRLDMGSHEGGRI